VVYGELNAHRHSVTAAGPFLIHTGFPIIPNTIFGNRQDLFFNIM